jgi:hypothetical protein
MFDGTEVQYDITDVSNRLPPKWKQISVEPYPDIDTAGYIQRTIEGMQRWNLNRHIVIGFAGYRRMGKSLSARLLTEALPKDTYTIVTHNFAEPIRKFADTFLNLSITPEMTALEKEAPIQRLREKSPRQIMQMTGDFFKSIHPDYFANYMRELIATLEPEPGKRGVFLIDDVRYEKEVEVIKEFGGGIWQMHCFPTSEKMNKDIFRSQDNGYSLPPPPKSSHSSDKRLYKELIELNFWWNLEQIPEHKDNLLKAFRERFTN